MKTVREKIRQQTERTRLRVDLGELVGVLNRIIKGWRAYFAIGNSTKKLADLDRFVWLRLPADGGWRDHAPTSTPPTRRATRPRTPPCGRRP